jgi:hypothetical protein
VITDAINRILQLQPPPTFEVGGLTYLAGKGAIPPPEPLASPLVVAGLDGLLDATKHLGTLGEYQPGRHALHVVSPSRVDLVGPLEGRHRQREVLLSAQLPVEHVELRGLPIEEFLVRLRIVFVACEQVDAVVALLSKVRVERGIEQSDDGLSQNVIVQGGVATVAKVQLPNPISLAPWPTFREITQPASLYLLRLTGSEQDGAKASLFRVDGDEWQLTARGAIATYLATEAATKGLGQLPIIA